MNKYRLYFEKKGRAVYISHLDLMRTFQRAFQRAGVPVKHTEGFNPHAHISIALPLPVGMESVCEILDFESTAELGEEAISAINAGLPEGIRALEIARDVRKTGEIAWLECELKLIYDDGVPDGAIKSIEELFASESVIILKKTKRGKADFDMIPCIKAIKAVQINGEEILVTATVAAQNPSLNPMLIVEAIKRYAPEAAPSFASCVRTGLFDSELKIYR